MKLAAAALAITLLAQAPTAQELRTRLSAYLAEYEPKLSELIADELMIQQNVRGSRSAGGGIGPPEFRTIRSEVAFIALPGDVGWMGFRRVTKVGSKFVDDGLGPLTAGLTAGTQDDFARARAMLAESARFNLGSPRTINLPNLPLELLHPRHASRFSVRVAGKEHIRGKNTTKLVFVEDIAPTIIRALDGSQMRSIISAFVEPASGRLWRADVITRDPAQGDFAFDHVVSVEFQNNQKLEMLVPVLMHEEFFAGANRRGWGDATYSNYRRFQTAARIVQ